MNKAIISTIHDMYYYESQILPQKMSLSTLLKSMTIGFTDYRCSHFTNFKAHLKSNHEKIFLRAHQSNHLKDLRLLIIQILVLTLSTYT